MAWSRKGMQSRREDKEGVRHQRSATKKKAIKDQVEGEPKKGAPKKKGKKK